MFQWQEHFYHCLRVIYVVTARSVRDRWVNIRSTFNHNLRRVDKSKETAKSPAEVHEPCWPLWKPLQFLREKPKKENVHHIQVRTLKLE